MTHVYLIRHGQASAGTDNYDRLSETGKEQALRLGKFWKLSGIKIDAAYSGGLERQQHTAELTLESFENRPTVQTLDALNEYDHATIDKLYGNGVQSDVGKDFTFDQYVEIMERWRDAPAHPDTMSWQDFSNQGWNAINECVAEHRSAHPDKAQANLAVFTSGGVISTILSHVMQSNFDVTMHALWQTRNASVTNILFNRHGVCVVDYNTVPHLQGSADSTLITQI